MGVVVCCSCAMYAGDVSCVGSPIWPPRGGTTLPATAPTVTPSSMMRVGGVASTAPFGDTKLHCENEKLVNAAKLRFGAAKPAKLKPLNVKMFAPKNVGMDGIGGNPKLQI